MEQDKELQTTEENYTKILTLASKVFGEWEGRITAYEDKHKIEIVSFNMLGEKRVECKVGIGLLNCKEFPFCVDADEKTYSIIGGCGCPCSDLEEVEERAVQTLERYKFRRKEQISLFDFNWEEE